MKPFLLISTRPEDETAEAEYYSFLSTGELEERELVQHRLEREPLPGHLNIHDYSGLILGGSPFTGSVPTEFKSDTQLRVEAELAALMDKVVAADFPLLGACYGVGTLGRHQGAVVDQTYSEEITAPVLTVTEAGRTDPLLDGVPDQFQSYVGHKEAISKLPSHATLLVSGEVAPVQMFRIKQNLYGTQFHPEADEAALMQRIEVYKLSGYFAPEDQAKVEDAVRGQNVAHSHLIVRNFVARYAHWWAARRERPARMPGINARRWPTAASTPAASPTRTATNEPNDLGGLIPVQLPAGIADIELMCFDLDGTLAGEDHQVSARASRALADLSATGVHVMIITGRAEPEARQVFIDGGFDGTSITSNGAVIADGASGRVIDQIVHRPETLNAAMDFVVGKEMEAVLFTATQHWVIPGSTYGPTLSKVNPAVKTVEVPREQVDAGKITKMCLMANGQVLDRYDAAIRELFPTAVRSMDWIMDIPAEGGDKGTALTRFLKVRGIDAAKVAGVGDSENDASWIERIKDPVAVENATDHVKELCVLTIGHHADDSVAELVEQIVALRRG